MKKNTYKELMLDLQYYKGAYEDIVTRDTLDAYATTVNTILSWMAGIVITREDFVKEFTEEILFTPIPMSSYDPKRKVKMLSLLGNGWMEALFDTMIDGGLVAEYKDTPEGETYYKVADNA